MNVVLKHMGLDERDITKKLSPTYHSKYRKLKGMKVPAPKNDKVVASHNPNTGDKMRKINLK